MLGDYHMLLGDLETIRKNLNKRLWHSVNMQRAFVLIKCDLAICNDSYDGMLWKESSPF